MIGNPNVEVTGFDQNGATPEFIPTHLRGQVRDFRNEADGTVSFSHPSAGNGADPETARKRLTKEQYQQTFDPVYQQDHFIDSMNGMYAPEQRFAPTTGESVSKALGGALRGAYNWGTSTEGKAIGTAGLLAAALGGAGGIAWGRSQGESGIGKALLLSLLGAGAGAGGMALAQHNHRNRERELREINSPQLGLRKTAGSKLSDSHLTMKSASDKFFRLGVGIAGSQLGLDRDEITQRMAREQVMNSMEAAPFHRELCKIAAAAFDAAGAANTPAGILFENLSRSDHWYPAYNRFTDSVRRALSKSATMLIPAVAATHDRLGGSVLKTLTAGGALTGAAVGSLAFLLSRNAQQSSAENAALLEKVRAYKKLKRDIEDDMAGDAELAAAAVPRKERYRG